MEFIKFIQYDSSKSVGVLKRDPSAIVDMVSSPLLLPEVYESLREPVANHVG